MNRLPLIVVGVVGLLAGGAIGAAAIGGDTKTETETATTVVTREKTKTRTVRRGGSERTRARTVTRTRTVTTPGYSAPGEPTGGGPVRNVSGTQTFSGKDTKQLGTLRVRQNSTLEWNNDGAVFSVISQTALHVSSKKKKGSVRLFKGTYPQFRVAAIGRWRITIKPR